MSLTIRIIDRAYENITSFNRDQIRNLTTKLLACFLNEFPYQPGKLDAGAKSRKMSHISIINDELQALLIMYWRDHNEFELIFRDNQALPLNSTVYKTEDSSS